MHAACGCAGASLACTTNMGEDVAVGDGVYVCRVATTMAMAGHAAS